VSLHPPACRAARRFTRNITLRFILASVVWSALWLSALAYGQSYTFNTLSTNAQPRPATDGTNVVTTDSAGDIIVIPFAGGAATTLVPAGTSLPNGLGGASGFTAFGAPSLINNVVYFGAQSNTGSGYYSIPLTGGAIHSIADSTLQDSSGRNVGAGTLPQELASAPFINYTGLPIPGIESNLFVSAAGAATFTVNLTSTAAPQGDLAIMNLSSSAVLTNVIDTNTLSGCTRISNFASDGTIFAVWALSTSNHLLLLENNAPTLSCSNVLLDLGAPGTAATNVLPGQPSSGSIMESYVAPSTVIDSGYIYFSATVTLTDTTINDGYYSGIFRVLPGGSVEKVLATDNTQLGTQGTVDSSGTGPLAICSSFAVRGNYVVLGTGWLSHYGWGGGLYPIGLFFFNQATTTLRKIAAAEEPITPTTTFYQYGGAAPTQAGLSADGKFAFELTVSDTSVPSQLTTYPALYTVNLLGAGTTTTLTGSPSPATYGAAVVLTATVTTTGSSSPTGQVSFSDGATVLGSATVNATGTATLTTTLGGGSHSLTATYAGDGANGPSTGSATLVVNPTKPGLNLSSSASSITATGSVTFTATALGVSGAAEPSGTVSFYNGTTALGTGILSSKGIATLSVNNLPVGANSITATYAGDANYSSINSAATTVNVSAISTGTTLSSSLATAAAGTAVTFTALVTASQGTISGMVNFSSNGTAIGSAAVSSSGSAVVAVTNLPVGTDSIQAVFAGNTFFPTSTSSPVSVTITGTSTFSLTSSTASMTIQQGKTGSATISLIPVGGYNTSVQFSCTGLPQNSTCTFAPSAITPGFIASTTTVTISTNTQSSKLLWPTGISYAGLLLLSLGGIRRPRHGIRHGSRLFFLVLLAAVLGGVVGCSGSSANSSTTPIGASTVVVTATSGANVKTTNLAVTIVR
jgi:hypothetical protein